MHPLEMLDGCEAAVNREIDSHSGPNTNEFVRHIVSECFDLARNAFLKGEFMITIEDIAGNSYTVDGMGMNISEVLADENNNKLLFISLKSKIDPDVLEQLSEKIQDCVTKCCKSVAGVILLQKEVDADIAVGRLNTNGYGVQPDADEDEWDDEYFKNRPGYNKL